MPTELALIEEVKAEMRAQVAAAAERRGSASRRLLTAAEAREYIGRTEQAVRHLIFNRDIPVVRMGRCVRIDRRDLDAWIENNKT